MKLLVAVLLKVKERVERHETARERDRNARRDREDSAIIVYFILFVRLAYFLSAGGSLP